MNCVKISFLKELQSKVKNECDACHEYTSLEYLVMDDKGTMFNVCKQCGAHLLKIMAST
jgi:hypothetical protein